MQYLKGHLGKQIVVKQYKDTIVISKFPNTSRKKPTALQQVKRGRFQEAVAYAKSIIRNPAMKEEYAKTLKKGTSVYHAAIREFMNRKA